MQGFSKIAAPPTSMLKTTGSLEESAPKAFRADDNEIVGGNIIVKNLPKSKKLKNTII